MSAIIGIKKVVSSVLCLSLLCPGISFAGNTAPKKTEKEVKIILTSQDKHITMASAGKGALYVTLLVAASGVAYKIGKIVGHAEGFGRGYTWDGLDKISPQAIKQLEAKIADLQIQLIKANKAVPNAESEVIRLIVRLNSQITEMRERRPGPDRAAFKKVIEKTIEDIYAQEVRDPKTRVILGKFMDQASKSLRKKELFWGLASVFTSVAAFVLLEGESEQYPISSARLHISRTLSAAFDQGEDIFTIKTFALKERYGTDLVASVVCENQTKYLPVLEKKINSFNNPQTRALAAALINPSAQNTQKQDLLQGLKQPPQKPAAFMF